MSIGAIIEVKLTGSIVGTVVAAALLVCGAFAVHAEEPAAPSADAVFDALRQSDPAAIKSALDAMRTQADALAAESAGLREQAAHVDGELEKVRGVLNPLQAFLPPPPKTVMAKEPTEATEAVAGPYVRYVSGGASCCERV